MPQDGQEWVVAAVEAAKEASPTASAIVEDLQQRLRGTMSERELTKAEQMQVAKRLIALARKPPAAGAGDED